MEGTGERAIWRAAAAQRRLVHLCQLRAAGFRSSAIGRLISKGVLVPVLPRVHAFGGGPLEPTARELAVILWLGHDAVISHRSAAWIWGLAPDLGSQVQATIIGRDARRHEGVTTHRVAELDSRDVRLRDGLPVTSPARTLIDLAGQRETDDDAITRALSEARVQRLVTDRELVAAMARCRTRGGVARLRAVLDQHDERIHSRHAAERRLIKLIHRARLPTPEANARVLGHEVDLLWRAEKLVVEMDGWAFHGHRAAFERDRDRDREAHRRRVPRDPHHLAPARARAVRSGGADRAGAPRPPGPLGPQAPHAPQALEAIAL